MLGFCRCGGWKGLKAEDPPTRASFPPSRGLLLYHPPQEAPAVWPAPAGTVSSSHLQGQDGHPGRGPAAGSRHSLAPQTPTAAPPHQTHWPPALPPSLYQRQKGSCGSGGRAWHRAGADNGWPSGGSTPSIPFLVGPGGGRVAGVSLQLSLAKGSPLLTLGVLSLLKLPKRVACSPCMARGDLSLHWPQPEAGPHPAQQPSTSSHPVPPCTPPCPALHPSPPCTLTLPAPCPGLASRPTLHPIPPCTPACFAPRHALQPPDPKATVPGVRGYVLTPLTPELQAGQCQWLP